MNDKSIEIQLIGMNDGIRICAEACSCCWDKKLPEGYEALTEYIANRTRTGHTSVLEHSNLMFYIRVQSDYLKELLEFTSSVIYLNTDTYEVETGYVLLIGGSFRGYADIYSSIHNINNPILQELTNSLYEYGNSGAFENLCSVGIMDKTKFKNIDPTTQEQWLFAQSMIVPINNGMYSIINMDSITSLVTRLCDIAGNSINIQTKDIEKILVCNYSI